MYYNTIELSKRRAVTAVIKVCVCMMGAVFLDMARSFIVSLYNKLLKQLSSMGERCRTNMTDVSFLTPRSGIKNSSVGTKSLLQDVIPDIDDEYTPDVELSVNKYNNWAIKHAKFHNLSQTSNVTHVSYTPSRGFVIHDAERISDGLHKRMMLHSAEGIELRNMCKRNCNTLRTKLGKVYDPLKDCNLFGLKGEKETQTHKLLRKAMVHHRCFRSGTRFEF